MNSKPKDTVKILVIDDETEFCEIMREFLGGQGYEVLSTSNAEDALMLLASERPHLALLDIRMPGMNGMTCLQRLRSAFPTLPVIMITALRDDAIARAAIEQGACDYLTKPIDCDYLNLSIAAHLGFVPN